MNQKNILLQEYRSNVIFQRKNIHFRIRSTSKDNFYSIQTQPKDKISHQVNTLKQENKNIKTDRFKTSKKQLKKILLNHNHKRQHSQNIQIKNLNTNNSQAFEHTTADDLPKIIYQNVKTQDENYLSKKNWIDINSIDTSQDIKILDRIKTLCDPFRMLHQCNSQQKLQKFIKQKRKQLKTQRAQRKSTDNSKLKSLSSKKSSKLAQKINNLVFEINSKNKQNLSSYKIHRNKFQSINGNGTGKQKAENQQMNRGVKNDQNVFYTAKQEQINKSGISNVKHNNEQKQESSSQRTHLKKRFSLQNIPQQLRISSKLLPKVKHLRSINPTKDIQLQKNQAFPNKQLKKLKQRSDKKPNQSKNVVMQKYWADVNQSLILAAQEEYVSKDLNEFLNYGMV